MKVPPGVDECRAELGEIVAACHRGDRRDAQAHARRLDAKVRRLRASLERPEELALSAIMDAYNAATEP